MEEPKNLTDLSWLKVRDLREKKIPEISCPLCGKTFSAKLVLFRSIYVS
jgi:uncharacterized protein (DUF2225 family)